MTDRADSDAGPTPPTPAETHVPIEARLAAAGLPALLRHAWLEVDLGVLEANGRHLRSSLPPGTSLGVVVKADGYGHGIEGAARAAVRAGAATLVVATLDEALALRADGCTAPILLLYPVPGELLAEAAAAAGVEVVVADDPSAAAVEAALAQGATPRVHLGVDSGMARGGIAPERAAEVAARLLAAGLGRLEGTWSHLASPENPAAVAGQVARFEMALEGLRAAGIDPGVRHLHASGGWLTGIGPSYDHVRAGLAFYGVLPASPAPSASVADIAAALRPALALRARPTTVVAVPAGTRVGYGGTWTAAGPSLIATLPLGYADGWARAYVPAWGVARGRRVPLVGRVGSDAVAADVTGLEGFDAHEEVTLLAGDGLAMSVADLAALRGSIEWEVLDALGARLARVYLRGDRVVGLRRPGEAARFTADA